ncbi:helix-turn-helix domain-containing protein [Pseudoduganella namucuonensis]|uniref:Transcriptional regulator, AraC family n=1 Tax=Pseudoduganella namucuonensis TaxID=1035707 RepID=A0A1I7JDD1_9BURK|nr:AraC family transcriptional regulator [Pseudoduganella namucuonensis]SFU83144.1 transcriptional regulator, AraC family [Pseudoduganella namucuonensis]
MPVPSAPSPPINSPALTLATNMTSRGREWQGVVVDWHDWKSGGYASSPALDHDVVALRISGPVRLMQTRDGKTHTSIAMPGNVTLDPRGMESKWSWDKPGAVAIARIPPTLLVDAAESALKSAPAAIELRNCFGRKDVFVERIITLFLDELRAPPHPAQTYITQALSSALACHMVCRFNTQGSPVQPAPVDMHTRAVQRVKDYIQENLDQHITLDTLASLANVSRFHFARVFRRSAGVSAMTFLERVRMERAKALIQAGGMPLSQVAMLVGYADQSYFTRRFRSHIGVTPTAYAREFGDRRHRP